MAKKKQSIGSITFIKELPRKRPGRHAKSFNKKLPKTIKLHSLKLQETGTSHAEWYASDQKTI